MTLSFKKIFKKEETVTKPVVLSPQTALKENVKADASDKDNGQKKSKHGEPGFCCGSCS